MQQFVVEPMIKGFKPAKEYDRRSSHADLESWGLQLQEK